MSKQLNRLHMPSVIVWLGKLHGEQTVRRIFGEDYQSLLSGEMDLDSTGPEVREILSAMVEAAVLEGIQPPLPPEPLESVPEVPGVPAEGGTPEIRCQPGHSGGPASATPAERELAPMEKRTRYTKAEIRQIVKARISENNTLQSLLSALSEDKNQRGDGDPLKKWIHLAELKTLHCLMSEYAYRFPGNASYLRPRNEELASYANQIKERELEIKELAKRSSMSRFFLGKGYLEPHEVIEQVASHGGLDINDALMQTILRQGRG